MKKFFSDFKKFISRGNVIDMAVGVIIGGAFSAIVTALTNKIIMPLINWLLSFGGTGLESAYTFLRKAYLENGTIDLNKSIYIDWGAFITAVINFFLIAFTLFIILKIAMKSSEMFRTTTDKLLHAGPSKAERKELKAQGVNMKDRKAVHEATKALRAKKEQEAAEEAARKAAEEAAKPTTEKLLAEILAELKKNNNPALVAQVEAAAETQPTKTEKTK